MNLNKVLLLGRLTADPQLRTTPSGQQVASFAIATNRNWTDRNGNKQEAAEFHNIVVWGRQAEIASRFLNKGGLVLVEGRLQTRSWDDRQGQRRKTTEIVADRIQLGPRPTGAGRERPAGTGPKPETLSQPPAEELPTIDIEAPEGEIKPEDLPF